MISGHTHSSPEPSTEKCTSGAIYKRCREFRCFKRQFDCDLESRGVYSFSSRIPPFEVERSSTGPPEPIVPSRLCLLICPCTCTSKSELIEPFDVWARKRAPIDGSM